MHVYDQRSALLEEANKGVYLAFPAGEVSERTF
jgi:hypothetical protein